MDELLYRDLTIKTGLERLDALMGGLGRGDLIVVAGRPGVGKSALAGQLTASLADQGHGVLFFALESGAERFIMRLMANESHVSAQSILTGPMTSGQWSRLVEGAGYLEGLPIYIEQAATLSLDALCERAREAHTEHGIRVVIIDYIHLVRAPGHASREQEIAEISRRLKELAKELRGTVIALSQLNRRSEYRDDHRPMLIDLRGSGTLEEDADVVVMLHREEMYDDRTSERGIIELIVRKNRHGKIGTAKFRFFEEFGAVYNFAEDLDNDA